MLKMWKAYIADVIVNHAGDLHCIRTSLVSGGYTGMVTPCKGWQAVPERCSPLEPYGESSAYLDDSVFDDNARRKWHTRLTGPFYEWTRLVSSTTSVLVRKAREYPRQTHYKGMNQIAVPHGIQIANWWTTPRNIACWHGKNLYSMDSLNGQQVAKIAGIPSSTLM